MVVREEITAEERIARAKERRLKAEEERRKRTDPLEIQKKDQERTGLVLPFIFIGLPIIWNLGWAAKRTVDHQFFLQLSEKEKIHECARKSRGWFFDSLAEEAWFEQECGVATLRYADVQRSIVNMMTPKEKSAFESRQRMERYDARLRAASCAEARADAEQAARDYDNWGDEAARLYVQGVPKSGLPPAPRVIDAINTARLRCQ